MLYTTQLICTVCGTEYTAKASNQKYCSRKCKKSAERYRKRLRTNNAVKQFVRHNPYMNTCNMCGNEYKHTTPGPESCFCSKQCKRDYYNILRRLKVAANRTCRCCGMNMPFQPRQHFCSDNCRLAHKMAHAVIKYGLMQCVMCDSIVTKGKVSSGRPKDICCSQSCAIQYSNWRIRNDKTGEPTQCLICGETFNRSNHVPNQKTCSAQCRASYLYMQDYNRYHIRRSKYDNGDDICRAGVFERDKYICQLCGEAIDINATEVAELPSIDHIKPLSKGGRHEWENVQATHYGCNASKHNKYIG